MGEIKFGCLSLGDEEEMVIVVENKQSESVQDGDETYGQASVINLLDILLQIHMGVAVS